ncbi:MAG: sugar phosphate isomerase/epimerase family protein [Bryobacterales bacterium]|nr:sugar phosphate isomerase/epimerase family protein [Bryobacterales bacterium]
MDRRSFLATTAATSALTGLAAAQTSGRLPVQKGLVYGMMGRQGSNKFRFQMAREAGFEVVETYTTEDPKEVEDLAKAAQDTGLKIHGVMNQAHWRYPLSSGDPEAVKISMEGMRTSLRNAKTWGAGTVLLVPAVVDANTTYEQAMERSKRQVSELIPLAEQLKVVIAIENVWNKFLLSPIEFVDYVDSFKSPYLQAYFDVGNIQLYGYPDQWLRSLGKRIARIHFKDFRFRNREAQFVNLLDGDLNWPAIYDAIAAIGYRGPISLEIAGGDLSYLMDVSNRFEAIIKGATTLRRS